MNNTNPSENFNSSQDTKTVNVNIKFGLSQKWRKRIKIIVICYLALIVAFFAFIWLPGFIRIKKEGDQISSQFETFFDNNHTALSPSAPEVVINGANADETGSVSTSNAPQVVINGSDAPAWAIAELDKWNGLSSGQKDLRTHTIKVGNTEQMSAASVWSGSEFYSTDAAVVTVDNDGYVTAIGEGQAFVAIKASTGITKCELFITQKK